MDASMPLKKAIKPRNKIRRTHYVDLNKLVWNYFKQCRSEGAQLNGKNLRDQAMRYAQALGLNDFRGSEGWLDAFKRRHQIDLKTMSGRAVCYEDEGMDDEEQEEDPNDAQMASTSNYQYSPVNIKQDPDENGLSNFLQVWEHVQQVQAQAQAQVAQAQAQATIDINNTQPLDISNLFSIQQCLTMKSEETGTTPEAETSESSTVSSPPLNLADENSTIRNLIKSCAVVIPDREVNHALDTIKAYILRNDPSLLPMIVDLQKKLSQINK